MNADELEDIFELLLVSYFDDLVGEEVDIDEAENFIIVIDDGQSEETMHGKKLTGEQNGLRRRD